MTTFVLFRPTTFAPFSFVATLDGQQYTVTITWNVYGQRWYFNVAALDGTPVVSEGLVGSPSAVSVSALSWSHGFATATTAAPHGYVVGSTAALVVAGCVPDAFNGAVRALVVDDDTLLWPIMSDPGTPSQLGAVSADLDLVEQYFETSVVVFREATQQFEIAP